MAMIGTVPSDGTALEMLRLTLFKGRGIKISLFSFSWILSFIWITVCGILSHSPIKSQ